MFSRLILTVVMTATLAAPCWAVDSGSMDPTDLLGMPEVPEQNNTSSAPVFQDVLDIPAAMSGMAVKSLFNGIARAGNRLVSVGERGHIIISDDQGKSWTQVRVPVSSDLIAVSFPTPQKGWAVGYDGVVLHSSDGGATWIKQFDGRAAVQVMIAYYGEHPDKDISETVQRFVAEGKNELFLDVCFENETTGYIVGAFNLIFQTTDGGKNWVPWNHRIKNPDNYHLFAIRRLEQGLFISGERGLLQKFDSKTGKFRALPVPYNGTFFGIIGKPGVVIAFGLRGNVFVSRNGGDSWKKVESGTEISLMGGTVIEDGRIVLVSATGQVLMSNDNGASFKLIKSDNLLPATAVIAADKQKLVLVGQLGVQLLPLK